MSTSKTDSNRLFGTPDGAVSIADSFKIALECFQSGRLEEAENICRQIIHFASNYPDALHMLGVIAFQQGKYDLAIEYIRSALRQLPGFAQAHYNLGNTYKGKGMLDDAVASYRNALALQPRNAWAYNNLADVLQAQGKLIEAIACYSKALEIDPDSAETQYNLGIALHEQGVIDEAIACFRKAIFLRPEYAEAHNNLGSALNAQGRQEEALESFDRAVSLDSGSAEANLNRYKVLYQLQRNREALECCDRAIALRPDDAVAHFNRGSTLLQLNDCRAALECFERTIALQPGYAEAYNNRGLALLRQNENQAALESFERAIALNPDFAGAYNNRGLVLLRRNEYQAALESFERASALNPDFAEAYNNRGLVLLRQNEYQAALESFEQAIALQPDYAEAYNDRGLALLRRNEYQAALESFEQAIALQPDFADAYNNRGLVLLRQNEYQVALESLDRAIALKPDFAAAYLNRGRVLEDLLRLDEAEADVDHAIALQPNKAQEANWNKALLRLLRGDFEEGWRLYEWRWKAEENTTRDFAQPLWLGAQPLLGKTILIHQDQGFGDVIQMCRYAPMVAALGANVVLEVLAPLVPLLASLPGVFSIIKKGAPLPPFDVHCPVMSLPLAFRTTLATVPAVVPYLHSGIGKREVRRCLGDATKPRIGLVWSGSAIHQNDHNRSISLQQLKPLLQLPLEFHSLQCEVRAEDVAVLASFGQVHLHQGELNDFSDTAALAQEMDLIISVDTSVAHLAGALAKPVWIMLPFKPDFRWMLGRSDSPWYPTATLFRQPVAGDWTSVIAAIQSELQSGYCFVKGLKRTDTMTEEGTTNHASDQNSTQLLEQAVAAQKTGQFQSAKELYLRFLQAESSHPAANHNMGVLMLEMGQAEESLPYFSAALDADPSSRHLWLGYIEALSRAGQEDDAKQILALARQQGLDGDEVEVLAARLEGGMATVSATAPQAAIPGQQEVDALLELFGQGRFAEAANLARSLTTRFPQDGFGWKVQGAVSKQLGNNAEALTSMQKATRLMPDDVEVYFILGVVLQDLGRSEEAEASYRQALAINPEYVDAYNNLGAILHSRGSLEEAATSFRRALQIKPDYASARGNLDAVLLALTQSVTVGASLEPLPDRVIPYQLVAARHGRFLVSPHDVYLGRAVIEYGEYGEIEWKFLETLMRSGKDAIEVGANIGTHTVSMASKLSRMGRRLLAVEPQPVVFQNMCANIALNGLFNVIAENAACSDTPGELTFQAPDYFRENNSGGVSMCEDGSGNQHVRSLPLDDLVPPEFDVGLIKIDVEGFEQKVLEGAVKTISRFRPAIYLENDRIEKSKALIEWLWAAGYKLWWHIPPLFNPDNYAGNSENIYGNVGSFNMLALPNESTVDVKGYARVEDSSAHPLQR